MSASLDPLVHCRAMRERLAWQPSSEVSPGMISGLRWIVSAYRACWCADQNALDREIDLLVRVVDALELGMSTAADAAERASN